jgi:phenylpropionate dioxygenase-like ring-hydroxylating dioxygenase large terminal subunit
VVQGSEHSHWHPVARSDALLERGVLAASLLGEQLVLWRDAAGVAHAWADRCPHRGAALSLGRVNEPGDALQCGYHGWCFDASAACVHVPAAPAWTPPATHSARAFGCVERFGLIWVCLHPESPNPSPLPGERAGVKASVPAIPWAEDPTLTHALAGPYAVATSAPRLVENFLDMTHFGFIHAGWLGDAAHAELPAYEVIEHDGGVSVPDSRVWQPQAFERGQAGAWVRYRYEVCAPYTVWLDKIDEGGTQLAIAMFNTPLADDQTLTWFLIAANTGQTPQQLIDFQNIIFAQDRPIVESQTPKALPLEPSAERHGPLDRVSAAYRRYLLRLGVACGVLG